MLYTLMCYILSQGNKILCKIYTELRWKGKQLKVGIRLFGQKGSQIFYNSGFEEHIPPCNIECVPKQHMKLTSYETFSLTACGLSPPSQWRIHEIAGTEPTSTPGTNDVQGQSLTSQQTAWNVYIYSISSRQYWEPLVG